MKSLALVMPTRNVSNVSTLSDVSFSRSETGILGESKPVCILREKLARMAPVSGPVLITGETGTGKELAARSLHLLSGRQNGPFVAVNCGGLGESMLEDTFFGHERGAFTGAASTHRGVFEQANRGTLFLDEIGELPLSQQAALLRVLDSGVICRIGSEKEQKVQFRLVTATNRNLMNMVDEGRFRLDLYHRISTLRLETPPLRHRTGDIGLLSKWFLLQMQNEVGSKSLRDCALMRLQCHIWPGNLRELKNVLYRAAVETGGCVIRQENLEFESTRSGKEKDHLEMSDEILLTMLRAQGGNVTGLARALGVPRSTLRHQLRRREILNGCVQ